MATCVGFILLITSPFRSPAALPGSSRTGPSGPTTTGSMGSAWEGRSASGWWSTWAPTRTGRPFRSTCPSFTPSPVAFSRLWARVAYSCPGPTASSSCTPSGEAEVAAWRAGPGPPPAPGNAFCRAPGDPGELGRGSPCRSAASPGCSSARRARGTGRSVRPTGPEPGASYVEGTPCGVLGCMGRPVKRSCRGTARPVPRWGRRGTGRALRAVTASARPADDRPKRRVGAP